MHEEAYTPSLGTALNLEFGSEDRNALCLIANAINKIHEQYMRFWYSCKWEVGPLTVNQNQRQVVLSYNPLRIWLNPRCSLPDGIHQSRTSKSETLKLTNTKKKEATGYKSTPPSVSTFNIFDCTPLPSSLNLVPM